MGQSRGNSTGHSKENSAWADRARRLLGRRVLTSVAAVMLVAAFILPVRAGDDGRSSTSPWLVVLLAVLFTLAFFVVLSLGLQLAGVDGDARTIARHLAKDPDQQRLLRRWLERARWARFVGGFGGLIVWVLGTQTHGDLLVLGTGGIAAGAALAELHHIRRASGPRTARIEVRTVRDYLLRRDALSMIFVAIAALVVGIGAAWDSATRAASWWAAGSLAALGVARLAQQRVATRARPAVSDKLTAADDLVRELAIGRGLARPFTFFALALLARACFALEPTIGDAAQVLGAIGWLCALVLWWRNRRLGLDFMKSGQRSPVLA